MYKFIVAVFVLCVFKDAASYSCFRNPSAATCSGDNAPCMVSCGGSCGGPFCSRTSNNMDYSTSCGCDQKSPVCSCLKALNQDSGCSTITISNCGCNSYNVPSSCGCNSYNSVPSSCGCNSYDILVPTSCGYSAVPICSCGSNSYNIPSSCGCNTYNIPSSCGCNSYNVPSSCGCNSYNLGSSCDMPRSSCSCSSCIRGSSCGAPNIYFPEVEYPVVTCGVPSTTCGCGNENPFYYGVSWEN